MSAFVIALVKVKDPKLFQSYADAVPNTLHEFGGEVVLRGKFNAIFEGNHDHQAMGVIKFPDQETLQAWYGSKAYQALVPTRNKAAELTIISYDDLPLH